MNQYRFLNTWQFHQTGSGEWLPAIVPGCVHTDLLLNGKIPDPFVADNEKRVAWVAESDWEYHTIFDATELFSAQKIYLVLDGLDTLADVRLNGVFLGQTDNMFRQYAWEVKQLLQDTNNLLEVVIFSPVRFILQKHTQRALPGVEQGIDGAPHLRKAPCQFGWDWGPRLPVMGIWKDVRLEGYSHGRLLDVCVRQVHQGGKVFVDIQAEVESWDADPFTLRVKLTTPEGDIHQAEARIEGGKIALRIAVNEPQLWWPNGYGSQPLYQLVVELMAGDEICETRQYQIGLRTVELCQQPDEWGSSFTFVVNGVPIFAKGANWIPADSFPTRISQEHLEKLLTSAKAAHMNMLRVWGGGFYEADRFYDLCDQYGILIWQDCIFSCSIYPLDEPGFIENVKIEIEQNLRRLRHHPSLALWCGNNEIEWGWESWGWSKIDFEDEIRLFVENTPSLRPYLPLLGSIQRPLDWQSLRQAYEIFFYQILPDWIGTLDPDTPYWTSSPSSDSHFVDVNGVSAGDTHNWEVWHGNRPFTAYRQHPSRFVSEFGFQSLPCLETIRSFAAEADLNLTSYVMEHHQRNASGNNKMLTTIADYFRLPKDFSSLIYLTQVLQAESMRIGVEFWRRNRQRTRGALYWQLNDCWPVASWSSLDYYGRWKAAHYTARRFFAPVLLSIEEQAHSMEIHLTSDLLKSWQGEIRWSLETLQGVSMESGRQVIELAPSCNVLMGKFDFSDLVNEGNQNQVIFVVELWQAGCRVCMSVATFVSTKHLGLEEPRLKTQVVQSQDDLCISLTCQSLARFVWIELDESTVFSDNYFDQPAGRLIEVRCPLPDGWTLARAIESLRVSSLFDSFS